MSYVDDNLLPSEEVVYRAHLHWVIYLGSLLGIVFGLVLLAAAMVLEKNVALLATGGLILLVALVAFFRRWLVARTSEFAVTNKRVLIKVGFVQRHSLELLLQKVEGIGVDQDLKGRIFNYGTIVVTGTGGTKEEFDNISHPLEFRKQVQARIVG
jgi:uncharacterized membrane protein YdbT with pleckstrin-like domain